MQEYEPIVAPGYIKLRGKEDCELGDMIVEANWTGSGEGPMDTPNPKIAIRLTDARRPLDPASTNEHLAEHSICLTSEQAREFARRILVEAETAEWNERRIPPSKE